MSFYACALTDSIHHNYSSFSYNCNSLYLQHLLWLLYQLISSLPLHVHCRQHNAGVSIHPVTHVHMCVLIHYITCNYSQWAYIIVAISITLQLNIPHLSILKLRSNTHRDSIYMQGLNICWVVQQNERNKCLGPFKRRVPKLLNLINLTMVPNVKENQLILGISLDVCISLLDVATIDRLQHIYDVRHLPTPGCTYKFYYTSQ